MPKPFIVLADPDALSLKPLEQRFLRELGESCNLETITDPSYLERFLNSPHDIDALLVAECWNDSRFGAQNVTCTFVLVDSPEHERSSDDALHYTFKYDSVSFIFDKVVNICPTLSAGVNKNAKCQIVVFYSPIGGSGCTITALGVAAALRSQYRRVLYIDAEYVQTFACYLEKVTEASQRMAVDMRRSTGDSFDVMASYIATEGFDYLLPLRGGLVANDLSLEYYIRFLNAAVSSNQYDYIVVDTDSVFDKTKTILFNAADKVVVIGGQEGPDVFKMGTFRAMLDTTSTEKFKFICNKAMTRGIEKPSHAKTGQFDWDGRIRIATQGEADSAASMGRFEDVRNLALSLV